MSKILITGHRGFIGSHLIEELTDHEIIGLDLKEGNDILSCELPDADIVIHLAAQTDVINSVSNPIHDARTNILGTIRLAERYKDSKFIFASSGGAIQEKIESPYGLSKFCAEEYIKLIHKNATILRFPNIFGPRSNSVVEKFINGHVYIFGDGSSTRDYVCVYNLVEAIRFSLTWGPGTYSLGSEKSVTVLELAQATGKPINFLPKVPGELHHSIVPNNTSWRPSIDVIKYIKDQCTN